MKLATNAMTGATLRVVEKEGEPWFVAKDVCDALGLANPTMSLRALDEDEQGLSLIETLGGMQKVNVVSESGLYGLILRSDKPAAKVFRKWVTSEVLPEIRRTGRYGGHGWEVELGRLEEAVRQAQDRLDDYRREVAARLGIIPDCRVMSDHCEEKRLRYGDEGVIRARVDYAGLAMDLPLPNKMVRLVQWQVRERGVKWEAARTRIYRMLKAGLLLRLADGRFDKNNETKGQEL
jgi:prophage antirepressor-like protein